MRYWFNGVHWCSCMYPVTPAYIRIEGKEGSHMLKNIKRKLSIFLVAAFAAIVSCVSAFAESAGSASTAVTGAMTTVANDMVATGNAIVPIALTVVGIALVVVFGVKMFKKVAK